MKERVNTRLGNWTGHLITDKTSRNSLYFGRRRCAPRFVADKPIIAEQSTEIYRQFRSSIACREGHITGSWHAAISLTRRRFGLLCDTQEKICSLGSDDIWQQSVPVLRSRKRYGLIRHQQKNEAKPSFEQRQSIATVFQAFRALHSAMGCSGFSSTSQKYEKMKIVAIFEVNVGLFSIRCNKIKFYDFYAYYYADQKVFLQLWWRLS